MRARRVEREFLGGFQEGMHRPVGLADALEGAAATSAAENSLAARPV